MKRKNIKIIEPRLPSFRQIESEFRQVWKFKTLSNNRYTRAFEALIEKELNVKCAIAVNSCTSGLMIAIKALGLSGEVIVPSYTFAATIHALIWNNCKPVFIDSDPDTGLMDISKVERVITNKTSAILPVYIYGMTPQLDHINKIARKYRLKIIYDAAQALGAKYKKKWAGGAGDAEVFSLSPSKVITGIEGGIITTNNQSLAEKICSMRDMGKTGEDGDTQFFGLSARFSELHAIVGIKNFKNLRKLIKYRKQLMRVYQQGLKDIRGLSFQQTPTNSESNYAYMAIFVDFKKAGKSRDYLYDQLAKKRIQTKKYFCPPVHLQKSYAAYAKRYKRELPVSEKLAQEALALPFHNLMTKKDVLAICGEIRKILV